MTMKLWLNRFYKVVWNIFSLFMKFAGIPKGPLEQPPLELPRKRYHRGDFFPQFQA